MISNNQVKFIQSLKQKKFREIHNQFIAEGSRLVLDLIGSPYRVSEIYADQKWISLNRSVLGSNNIPFTLISESEMNRISALSSPSSVLAILEIPPNMTPPAELKNELVLMLDDIRDPGNFGTIVRIADWFGISTIICSANVVDLYNPKVVQATMGSIARVNVIPANLEEYLKQLNRSIEVFGTFMSGENIYSCNLPSTGIIVIGNESSGISPEISAQITTRLHIPSFANRNMLSHPESLNAAIATAIVCAEFRRRGIQ
jgi:RNA methyltransferase, TrmH family